MENLKLNKDVLDNIKLSIYKTIDSHGNAKTLDLCIDIANSRIPSEIRNENCNYKEIDVITEKFNEKVKHYQNNNVITDWSAYGDSPNNHDIICSISENRNMNTLNGMARAFNNIFLSITGKAANIDSCTD